MRKEYGQCVRTTVYWHDYVISRISELFKVCLCQNLSLSKFWLWKKRPPPFLLSLLPWWWGGKMVCFWTHVLWEPVYGEGDRRCQEVDGREGVIIMCERWGWVLVFSLWGSSSPTFLICFGFFLKIGLLSLIILSNYIVIPHTAYKLVCVRIIRVRKGGKC